METLQAALADASKKQVIEGANVQGPAYALYITGDNIQVNNIIVKTAAKGIVLDNALASVLKGIEVTNVGAEGIHVRDSSKDTLIEDVRVTDTGRVDKGFGEGIYVGSDRAAWLVRM